jgi:hypothetical protein
MTEPLKEPKRVEAERQRLEQEWNSHPRQTKVTTGFRSRSVLRPLSSSSSISSTNDREASHQERAESDLPTLRADVDSSGEESEVMPAVP